MSGFHIRQARPDEAEAMRRIEDSAAARFRGSKHAYVLDGAPRPAEIYAALAAQGLVLIAERKGEAIGFAACEPCPGALHLKELAVDHPFQGQGAGRALVAAVAEEARRRALPAVTLTTFADLSWNRPWYERLGFAELREGQLGEWLRQILEDEYERGLTDRCAMRLSVGSAP